MTTDEDRLVAPSLVASTSRHPSDAVRMLVGAMALAVAVLAVYRDQLSAFESNLFRLVNDLPDAIGPYLNIVMQAGNALAAPIVGVIVVATGRWRNWRAGFDVAVAGTCAWFAAKLVKDVIQRPRPGGMLDEVARFGSTEGLGFVSGHTAVAAAIACAVAPYLPRAARRAVWAVPWIVGFARIYFGAHLPLDIIGGVALGLMIGAGLHLLLGAPHGAPSLVEAERVLRAAGWDPLQLERLPGTHRGSFPFVATLADGTVFVKLLDPDIRDRDLLLRVARFIALREVRDEVSVVDPRAQADREAAMTLLAIQHGARVPRVLAITRQPNRRGLVWLVLDHVPSRDLRWVDPDEMNDGFLADLWRQVAALRRAGVAHRDLVASNVLLDVDGKAWVVDFAHAETSAPPHALANDVAELLAVTALRVGVDRAVAVAVDVLGADAVAEAELELVRFALTPDARRELRAADRSAGMAEGGTLQLLRQSVLDRTAPDRNHGAPVVTSPWWGFGAAAAITLAVLVVLGAVGGGGVVHELVGVSPRWLGVATVAWLISAMASSVAIVSRVERRLAVGRTAVDLAVASSAAFSGGRRSGLAVLASRLGKAGVSERETEAAVRRSNLAGWMAWTVVTGIAVVEAVDVEHTLVRPDHVLTLALVTAAGLALHLLLAVQISGTGCGPRSAGPRRAFDAARWAPVSVAVVVEMIAVAVAGIALVTAFPTPMPASYAALLSLLAWAIVHLPPGQRSAGVRPAILTMGVAAAGAPIEVAAAVGIVAGLVELAGIAVAQAFQKYSNRP